MCYELIELKEGEPVVFLGVHALRWNWQEWGEPKAGFIDCDCNQKVDALQAENERLRQDRADALNVKSRDGLLSSEWLLRTGIAERKQAELEAENERLRNALKECLQYVDVDNLTMQSNVRRWQEALKAGDE